MSASGTVRKRRNDKQIEAIIFNMKEQRLLDKVYQALRLEESHALKLLRLAYIDVKANQSRIERKVSKIRSHLTEAEIAELRQLEAQGKLGGEAPRTSNSALRIQCAVQRLKITPTERLCATPRHGIAQTSTGRAAVPETDRRQNAKALSGSSQTKEAAMPASDRRKGSETQAAHRIPVQIGTDGTSETQAAHRIPVQFGTDSTNDVGRQDVLRERQARTVFSRPLTSQSYTNKVVLPVASKKRPQTAHCVLYSSHDIQEVVAGGSGIASSTCRTNPVLPATNLAATITRQRANDVRRERLNEEQTTREKIEGRRQKFLNRTAQWVDANRAITDPDPGAAAASIRNLKNRDLIRRACALGRKLNLATLCAVRKPREQTDDGDAAWNEIRKCRYIRANEDQLDSSGVNTLASEQFSLLQRMRIADLPRKPRVLSLKRSSDRM